MYRNVLVAVDLSHGDLADHLLKPARHLARAEGRIALLSIVQPLPSDIGLQAGAEPVEKHRRQTEEQLHGDCPRCRWNRLGRRRARQSRPRDPRGGPAARRGRDRGGLASAGARRLADRLGRRVVRNAPCTVVVDRSALAT